MQLDSNIIIVDLFREVVEAMRDTGVITSSVEVTPGNYVCQSPNTFKDKDAITIGSDTYLVGDVTATQFTITSTTEGLDFTGETWVAKFPYYMHGHPVEINNRLTNKNKSAIYSYQKYPLIALIQDFSEPIGNDLGNYTTVDLRVVIAVLTKPDINAEDRYDLNFRNVLYPLYNELINQIHRHNAFYTRSARTIQHTKIDMPYYGTSEDQGNTANYHDDYLDAIEITFNDLVITDTRC